METEIFKELVLEDENTVKLGVCIISPHSIFKMWWDLTILVIVIYQAITIPIKIGFEDKMPSQQQIIFDLALDGLFLIDIIINFMSAYEDDMGELVTNRKTIAKQYF